MKKKILPPSRLLAVISMINQSDKIHATAVLKELKIDTAGLNDMEIIEMAKGITENRDDVSNSQDIRIKELHVEKQVI